MTELSADEDDELDGCSATSLDVEATSSNLSLSNMKRSFGPNESMQLKPPRRRVAIQSKISPALEGANPVFSMDNFSDLSDCRFCGDHVDLTTEISPVQVFSSLLSLVDDFPGAEPLKAHHESPDWGSDSSDEDAVMQVGSWASPRISIESCSIPHGFGSFGSVKGRRPRPPGPRNAPRPRPQVSCLPLLRSPVQR